ncbi:MAG: hypothetical protein AB1679_24855 [Actinomycetota bacterium]
MSSTILGHCRSCHFFFELAQLVRASFLEGHCPNCGQPLATDTRLFLKTAARTVIAHEELVENVRALMAIPGNFELLPHTLVRDILEDIDWEDRIAQDRELVQLEIDALQRYLRDWKKLEGEVGTAHRSEIRAHLSRLAGTLRRLAGRVESREGEAMEAAATRIDAVAASMGAGWGSEEDMRAALGSAQDSVGKPTDPDLRAPETTRLRDARCSGERRG